jgi:GNAT superfamily N-acetyltransferase
MIVKRVVPLSSDTWTDLEELFGTDGVCAGCWCMWWRTAKPDYRVGRGNRHGLRAAMDTNTSVGLLAYGGEPDSDDERVVGWCAVAPRSSYPRLAYTAVGRGRRDEEGRWAVPCFFVRKGHRRSGITDELLAAACEHSRAHGAAVVEGYPFTGKASQWELFVGTKNLFARHGFVVVREATSRRAVMERTFT